MSEQDATSDQENTPTDPTPTDAAAHEEPVRVPADAVPVSAPDRASVVAAEPTDATADPHEAAEPTSTGDPRVDAALTRLGELDRLNVTEHAGVVEEIHRALQDTLTEEED